MTTIASLIAKIGAQTAEFQDAMQSSARAAAGAQAAMQSGAQAATLLQNRLIALKEAAALGAISLRELGEGALTIKADAAELATQGTLAENTLARLASTSNAAGRVMRTAGGGVGEISTAAEHSVSRLAFGMGMLASGASRGALGLRSVEFGLMGLLPGLGWGLVAITAMVEGYRLYSDSMEKTAAEQQKLIDKIAVHLNAQDKEKEGLREVTARINELKKAIAEGRPDMSWLNALQSLFGDRWAGMTPSGMYAAAEQRARDEINALNLAKQIARANEARNQAAEAARQHAEKIKSVIEALERERATFGMSTAQIQVYELRKAGASAATMRHAQALADELGALERAKEAAKAHAEELKKLEEERLRTYTAAEAEMARILRAGEAELRQHYDRERAAAQKHADDLKGVFSSVFESLSRGNIGGVVEAIGRYGIGQLTRQAAAEPEAAAYGLPPAGPLRGIMDIARQQNLLRQIFTLPGLPQIGTLPPIGARSGASHTVQSAVHFHIATPNADAATDFLKKYSPELAGLVVKEIAKSPSLISFLNGVP